MRHLVFRDCPGYLKGGLPLEYGEGAADIIRDEGLIQKFDIEEDEVRLGDWERVKVEWKSLLAMIATGKGEICPRWKSLKKEANRLLGKSQSSDELPKLPEIPARQREVQRLGDFGNCLKNVSCFL